MSVIAAIAGVLEAIIGAIVMVRNYFFLELGSLMFITVPFDRSL
jgi:hypothetical protein